MHYKRWQRTGELGRYRGDGTASFWRKVDKTPTCWLWTGTSADGRYGRFHLLGRNYQAHRWAYEQLVGPIPEGLQLDHLCRVTLCVNPDHLEPVTGRVNTLRGNTIQAANAAKTHCKHGHPFDEANTYIRASDNGRICRTCQRERMATVRASGRASA